MKRLVYSEDLVDDAFEIDQVVSVILVDDIEDFNPRDIVNRDILSSKRSKVNYPSAKANGLVKAQVD